MSLPPQLNQAFITNPEMVGDLVVERLAHAIHERVGGSIDTHERSSKEGDLARERDAVRTKRGARHALVLRGPDHGRRLDPGSSAPQAAMAPRWGYYSADGTGIGDGAPS